MIAIYLDDLLATRLTVNSIYMAIILFNCIKFENASCGNYGSAKALGLLERNCSIQIIDYLCK